MMTASLQPHWNHRNRRILETSSTCGDLGLRTGWLTGSINGTVGSSHLQFLDPTNSLTVLGNEITPLTDVIDQYDSCNWAYDTYI